MTAGCCDLVSSHAGSSSDSLYSVFTLLWWRIPGKHIQLDTWHLHVKRTIDTRTAGWPQSPEHHFSDDVDPPKNFKLLQSKLKVNVTTLSSDATLPTFYSRYKVSASPAQCQGEGGAVLVYVLMFSPGFCPVFITTDATTDEPLLCIWLIDGTIYVEISPCLIVSLTLNIIILEGLEG